MKTDFIVVSLWRLIDLFASPSRCSAAFEVPSDATTPMLACDFHDRRLPRAVEDGFLRPIGTEVERERPVRRWQPVAFFRLPGRLGTGIERERTVGIEFESSCSSCRANSVSARSR